MGSKAQSKHDKLLKELARVPANKKCAICTCMGTQYTCQPPGIYVCETCAGAIRSFPGFRVKSRTMATFTAEDVNALKDGGNERFVEKYLRKWTPAAFPAPTDRQAKSIETFVRQVLVEKLFYQEDQQSMQQSSPMPKNQSIETNTKVRTTFSLQSKSISEPGWRAFDGPTHAPSSSFDHSRSNPNSDSWADFSAVAVPSGTSQQTPYDFDQSHPQLGSSVQSSWLSPKSVPRATSIPTPQGWNAFDDPAPLSTPRNTALNTGGSLSTGGKSPSVEQNITAAKPPIMKELPQDLFGPPQEHTPINQPVGANPFVSGSFSPQGITYVQPGTVPAAQPPAQQYMPQGMTGQGFTSIQPTNQGVQQQPHHHTPFTAGISRANISLQEQTSAGSFSPVQENSLPLSGSTAGGDESDHSLFGNLVGDLRSSMPKSRPPLGLAGGGGSFQGSYHGYRDLSTAPQFSSFQQRSAFAGSTQQQMGFDGDRVWPGGFMDSHQNSAPGGAQLHQNAFGKGQMPGQQVGYGSFPQHGYNGMPQGAPVMANGFPGKQDSSQYGAVSGLARQEQTGFQGGIQSSGNPFA